MTTASKGFLISNALDSKTQVEISHTRKSLGGIQWMESMRGALELENGENGHFDNRIDKDRSGLDGFEEWKFLY